MSVKIIKEPDYEHDSFYIDPVIRPNYLWIQYTCNECGEREVLHVNNIFDIEELCMWSVVWISNDWHVMCRNCIDRPAPTEIVRKHLIELETQLLLSRLTTANYGPQEEQEADYYTWHARKFTTTPTSPIAKAPDLRTEMEKKSEERASILELD